MIDAGLLYAILSPAQAERVRPLGTQEWQNVFNSTIDPRRCYRYFHRDGSGRSIVIFFYDPEVSLAIAFEGALAWSSNFVDRLARALGEDGEMANVATDGESYGHHFPFGDRCLAYSLDVEARSHGLDLTNYGEFLARHSRATRSRSNRGPTVKERPGAASTECSDGIATAAARRAGPKDGTSAGASPCAGR
jgi:hypothetical protein